jgi:hypothetical protein
MKQNNGRPDAAAPRSAPGESLNVVRMVLGYHAGGTITVGKYFSIPAFDRLLGLAGSRVNFNPCIESRLVAWLK